MLVPYSKSYEQKKRSTHQLFESVNEQSDSLIDSTVTEFSFANSFTGFKQPGYKKLIKLKQNATTVASGTKVSISSLYSSGTLKSDFGSQRVRRTAIGYLAERNYLANPLFLGGSVPWSEIQNNALLLFLKKCKDAQRQFQAGTFAGELRETLHLIRRPASALRELVFDYVSSCRRRAGQISARHHANLVANQYLEFSFGALPLISDVKSGFNALERLYLGLKTAYVRAVVERLYYAKNDTVFSNLWGNYLPILANVSCKRTGGLKIVGEVRIQPKGLSGFREALGLNIEDFIPTVYNLIPYSFLVDYFTNIGDLLEAASFNQADLVWYSYTQFTEDLERYEIVPSRPATLFGVPVIDYYVSPGVFSRQSKTFSRFVPPLGVPSLAFKIPGNWSKFLNIGALASLRVL